MKKIYLAIFAAAAMFASCQEQSELNLSPEGNVEGRATLTAAVAPGTKISYTESGEAINLAWESTDSFTLYDANGDRVCGFEYSSGAGTTSGTFVSEKAVTLTQNATYTAVIPASDAETLSAREAEYSIASQTVADIAALDHLNGAVRLSAEFEYITDDTITFTHEVSLVKLSVELDEGVVPTEIMVYDAANSMTYTTTLPGDMASTFTTYIAVEAAEVEAARDITFTITDSEGETYIETKSSATSFVAGKYYSASLSFLSPAGDNIFCYAMGWSGDGMMIDASDNDGVYELSNNSAQTNDYDTQFVIVFGDWNEDYTNQVNGIEEGYTYTVTMMVKTDGEVVAMYPSISSSVEGYASDYLGAPGAWQQTTDEWTEFTFVMSSIGAEVATLTGGNKLAISIGLQVTTFYVKDIAVYRVADSVE